VPVFIHTKQNNKKRTKMKFSIAASAGLALATPTAAIPLASRDDGPGSAASIIAKISPASVSCAEHEQCRTNVEVAQPFIDAFNKYGFWTYGQIAAVLSLTAYESADFKYKHNISPGRPGQGTSNMQMIDFNRKYAASFPELADSLKEIGDPGNDDNKKNQILALVTDDKYNFGSGPWFLKTQCPEDVQENLKKGTDDAWNAYMSCVGVVPDEGRTAYWSRAKAAFGL